MAYQGNNRGTYSGNRPAQAPAAPAVKKQSIFSTGLFAPTKEGVKSLGSIQVKEDVTIPAGSYINLYTNDKKGDNMPVFRLSVTEGKLKAQRS